MLELDPRVNHSQIIVNYDPSVLDTRGVPHYVPIGDRGVRGEENIDDLMIVIFGSFHGGSIESGLKLLKSFDRNNAKKGNQHRLSVFASYLDFHQKPFSYFSDITDERDGSYNGLEKICDLSRGQVVFSSTFVVAPINIHMKNVK